MTESVLGQIARLHTRYDEDVAIAGIDGEIDLSNAAALVEELEEAVDPGAAGLVLDLARCAYLDSAGIRGLFEMQRHLLQHRQQLRIVVPPESPLLAVLRATGVQGAIPMHDDCDEAVMALRGGEEPPRGLA